MGNFLTKGTTYVDGVTQLNAANLNALVDEAILKPEAISALSLKDPLGRTESLMINDAGTLKKTTVQAIADATLTAVPIGAIIDYAGFTPPAGWFLCQGQSISRTTYSSLFEIIGTTYGTLDSTLFSLPDCRGRVCAGVDQGAGRIGDPNPALGPGVMNHGGLGAVGGLHYHPMDVNQMPFHSHTFNDVYSNTTGGGGTLQFGNDIHIITTTTPSGTAGTGGGFPHNNMQPTIVLQKIIKY